MGQIFISAAHGGYENGVIDQGSVVPGTTEAAEMIRLRDQILAELRSRNLPALSVPDDLSAAQTLAWINSRCRPNDVALEIHAGTFNNPAVRGAIVYYIANNDVRRAHGEWMILALLRRIPQLPSRGVKPDTASGSGTLAFCRQTNCPSLLMEVGFLSNPQDLAIIQGRRQDMAIGIADGLSSWSRAVSDNAAGGMTIPVIGINVNGGLYDEKGILVNDNAYIPIDLVDRLGINVVSAPNVRRVNYNNVVYVKAVDLRDYGISVGWDAPTRTLLLRSASSLTICPGLIDQIMGRGNTSETQLRVFLQNNNEAAATQYKDIPALYRKEAMVEGINYDIAFCQMCVETAYLTFPGSSKASQYNFGGIGSVDGSSGGASFPSAVIGVRSHIQHLKAYASTEPLVQTLVDPRFRFVRRGVAPLVNDLSGRWNADLQYGEKIMAVLRRLYESARLFGV